MKKSRPEIVLCLLALVMSLLVSSQLLGGELITNITRTGSTWSPPRLGTFPFGQYSQCYVDRTHLYSGLPGEVPGLVGAEYVLTAENDRNVDNVVINLTLANPAKVYLILDNQLGGTGGGAGVDPVLDAEMAWVYQLGFSDTGLDIGIDEGGNGFINEYSSIFVADMTAGTHAFQEQHAGLSRHMYGIVAVPGEAESETSATIDITPDTLNLSSQGKWISASINLSAGDVADIDIASILLNGKFPAVGHDIQDNGTKLVVKFSRNDVKADLAEGSVELTVTGSLNDGTAFIGTDTIRVIDRGSKGKNSK